MQILRRIFFTGILICASQFVIAQNNLLTDFLQKVEQYGSRYAQEKVYLHLDKPYYAVGDNIWFKAYILNAKTGKPSAISGILYVELINEEGLLTKKLKLPVKLGTSWGDFSLADTLQEGNYRIRAYTQWMRNAGPDFFFDKTIKIGNSWTNRVFIKSYESASGQNSSTILQFTEKNHSPYANSKVDYEVKSSDNKILQKGQGLTNEKGEIAIDNHKTLDIERVVSANITLPNKQVVKKRLQLKTVSQNTDVQFFPEGGIMLEGFPNRMAIKAIKETGQGTYLNGVIEDDLGNKITNFETNQLGMGSFYINPTKGRNYSAKITQPKNKTLTINLPQTYSSGTALAVDNLDSLKMRIRLYFSSDKASTGPHFLVVQKNGSIHYYTEVPVNNGTVTFTVPKENLPSGIFQVSLLSSSFKPLNERIVFVNNLHDKINITSEKLQSNYAKKSPVEFPLTASNGDVPLQGSFSVAVTNTLAVKPDENNESNILVKLLLTADLAGYVESPNYYFNHHKNATYDLDNLLLTQGWRKINWKDLAEHKETINTFPPEKNLKISGTVSKAGKPVVKGKVSLVSTTQGFFMIDTLTDDKGRFCFDNIEFSDSLTFIVQARTSKDGKLVDIALDQTPDQLITKNPNNGDIEVNINSKLIGYLDQSEKHFEDQEKLGTLTKTNLLKQVTITGKRQVYPESQNINGRGHADRVITAKVLETAVSLNTFLMGRFAGITVNGNQAYLRGSSRPMLIVIDGKIQTNGSLSIPTRNIEMVEILKSAGYTSAYGGQGSDGVIVITSKKHDPFALPFVPHGIVNYAAVGYSYNREFYSPKYVKEDNKPDHRTTVFWEPNLITDKNGIANISYFNTDVPGTYRIVIEGIDVNGSLARKVLTYEVK